MQSATVEKVVSELNSKKLQLHWLLQITKAINYNLPADQLFEVYHNVLKNQLHVGKLILFVNDNGWRKILSYGVNINENEINHETIFDDITNFHERKNPALAWMNDFESVIPVFHNDKPLAYALVGDMAEQASATTKEILPFIHTITNIIVVAIENKRLNKESIIQAAVNKELQLAAEMQAMLFPSELHGNDNLEIAAYYLPHQQVGGDYYDYIVVNENESVICMADVSGKGMAAALLMSNFQANLHAFVKHSYPLRELIHELNRSVNKSAKGEKYITFFVALINHRTKMISYVNAGHNAPLLFHQGEISVLDRGTTGLGMFDELPFLNEGNIHFPTGSILFCYTDGITELEDTDGNAFGLDRLKNILCNYSSSGSMNNFHELILNELNLFRQHTAYNDDVTMLSCRSKA